MELGLDSEPLAFQRLRKPFPAVTVPFFFFPPAVTIPFSSEQRVHGCWMSK